MSVADQARERAQAALSALRGGFARFERDTPVNKKLNLTVGGLLALVAACGGGVVYQFARAGDDISAYRTATRANVSAEEALNEFTAMRVAARDYADEVAAGDSEDAARYRERLARSAQAAIAELRRAHSELGDDPVTHKLDGLGELVEHYRLLALSADPGVSGVRHEIADRLSFELDSFAEILTARRDAIGPRLDADTDTARLAAVASMLVLLLTGMLLLVGLRRGIGAPVAELGKRLREGGRFTGDILSRKDEIGAAANAANAYMDHVAVVARLEAESREATDHLNSYQNALDRHGMVVITDAEGALVYANDGFCDFAGYDSEALAARFAQVFVQTDDGADMSPRNEGEIRVQTAGGGVRWLAATRVHIADAHGVLKQIVHICHDISARVSAEASASRKQEIADLVSRMWSERVSCGSAAFSLARTLEGLLTLFGGKAALAGEISRGEEGAPYSTILCRAAAPGANPLLLASQGSLEIICQQRLSTPQRELIQEGLARGAFFNIAPDPSEGEQHSIGVPILVGLELLGVLIVDASCRIREENRDEWESVVTAFGELLVAQRDADRRLRAEADAALLARQDALTGLGNRRILAEAFDGRVDHPASKFGLIMIDLDRFKPINDTYGHLVGDQLLRVVASRLREAAHRDCDVIRLGGDEFAILTAPSGRPVEEVRAEVSAVAMRILELLQAPMLIDNLKLTVGASIGVAMFPSDASDVQQLLSFADASMYRAKERRGEVRFFDASVDEIMQERAALEVELRSALDAGDIVPYFQPIVALETGAVVGHEMLARWRHPTRGEIGPTTFIPIAEAAGLIDKLFWQLLRGACTAHFKAGCTTRLSVNLSPTQIGDQWFAQKIIQALTVAGFPPSRLEVEVTESDVVADSDKARAMLLSLKAQGVRVALDDFGTGYSSLLVLRDLPIDKLKIDRSFVSGLAAHGRADTKIIDAVLGMAEALGLEVTAEGVETAEVAEFLRRKGCQTAQGYLYGAARPDFAPALELKQTGSR
jgi:diguanylate cyclase (GGDEF)-like protein/PAS domain S-box-containing protein